jgi:hypothetical protein
MSFNKTLTMLSGCLICSGYLAAQAETIEKTTTETTTVQTVGQPARVQQAEVAAFVFPAESSYIVVDGRSGIVVGNYDVASKLLEGGQIPPTGALIVEKSSGRLVATVDATGRVVDVYASPVTETLSTTIIERRARLSKMINDAVAAGVLSKEQAAAMRAELDRIAAETASGAPQLTYGNAMVIGYNLDLLSDRLVPIVRTTETITPVVPAEFIVTGGRLSMVDKLTYRRVALERRVDDEYKAGRLASSNVSRLKTQLDQVASQQSKYKNSNGQLSGSEQRKLAMRLDQVQSTLDSDVSHINHKRSEMGLIVN